MTENSTMNGKCRVSKKTTTPILTYRSCWNFEMFKTNEARFHEEKNEGFNLIVNGAEIWHAITCNKKVLQYWEIFIISDLSENHLTVHITYEIIAFDLLERFRVWSYF